VSTKVLLFMGNKKILFLSFSRSPWILFFKYLVFSILPFVLLLFVSEVVLRVLNFRYSDTPLVIQSQPETTSVLNFSRYFKENPDSTFVKDKLLFWTQRPYWEDQYVLEKPRGITRIMTLGCSCTHGCDNMKNSYPNYMDEILEIQFPDSYQVINAGASGYSSYQGLQVLRHVILKYQPEIVTIFFGWNDHWFASKPDHLVRVKEDWEVSLINFLEKCRTYQAYHWMIAQLKEKVFKTTKTGPSRTFRVPQEKYKANLNAMVDFCQSHNIKPVLMTAPFDASQLAGHGPTFFCFNSYEDLVKTHMAYNHIVREVGASRQVPVIDLERVFFQLEKKQSAPYFTDGIHLSSVGCPLAASFIVEKLREFALLKDPPVKN